jgi:RNA-directed DNA polymerase
MSKGLAYMVRYADDSKFCFELEEDARAFYTQKIKPLSEFNLEIAEEKNKIISLNNRDGGNNGPGTDKNTHSFDFLGFTHYPCLSEKGKVQLKRKTSKAKYRASHFRVKEWIKRNRHIRRVGN